MKMTHLPRFHFPFLLTIALFIYYYSVLAGTKARTDRSKINK